MEENEAGGMRTHDYQDSQSWGLGQDGSQPSDHSANLSTEMYSALTALASNLCGNCQNMCGGEVKVLKYRPGYGYSDQYTGEMEHHESLSSLRESVHDGCPLCKELAQSFEGDFDMRLEALDPVAESWYITCYIDTTRWCFTVAGLRFHFIFYDSSGHRVNPKLGEKDMYVSFFPAECLGLGPEYIGERRVEINFSSQANKRRVCWWIPRCDVYARYWLGSVLVQQVFG